MRTETEQLAILHNELSQRDHDLAVSRTLCSILRNMVDGYYEEHADRERGYGRCNCDLCRSRNQLERSDKQKELLA